MLPPAQLTAFAWTGAVALALVGLGVGLHARATRDERRAVPLAVVSGILFGAAFLYRLDFVIACTLAVAVLVWGAPRRRAIALAGERDRNRVARARALRARRVRRRVPGHGAPTGVRPAPRARPPDPTRLEPIRRFPADRRQSSPPAVVAAPDGRRAQTALLLVLHQSRVDRLRDCGRDLGRPARPHVDPRPRGARRWAAQPRGRVASTPACRFDAYRLGQLHLHLARARRDDGGAHRVGAIRRERLAPRGDGASRAAPRVHDPARRDVRRRPELHTADVLRLLAALVRPPSRVVRGPSGRSHLLLRGTDGRRGRQRRSFRSPTSTCVPATGCSSARSTCVGPT